MLKTTQASLVVLALTTGIQAQDTILLDDFDADNSDELFGTQGLVAFVQGNVPTLDQNENTITGDDLGAVLYSDTTGDINLVVGQYPNDAGAVGASLGLDFESLRVIGFEIDFAQVSTPFPFGLTLEDDGPSGTAERRVAAFDITVPEGDTTVRTFFDEPGWNFEVGFDFSELRGFFYELNNNPRATPDVIAPVENVAVRLLEFRAITTCLADVNRDGVTNGTDFGTWLGAFSNNSSRADQNEDGLINGLDFGAWLNNFNTGCDVR